MLLAYCLFNIAWLFLWCMFARRDLAITIRMFLSDTLPYLVVATGSMLATALLTRGVESLSLLLLLRVPLATVLYFSLSYVCRFDELREAYDYIFRRKKANGV